MTVTAGAAAGAMMNAMDNDLGYTADGECRGVKVSVASHASTLGPQLGELSHVYSTRSAAASRSSSPRWAT